MSWLTIIWSMVASACLTLAGMHLLVWFNNRAAWASLAFAVAALGVVGATAGEFAMMRAHTPDAFGAALRWANVPVAVMIAGLVWFVHAGFGTGRAWLAWLAVGLRLLTLTLHFTTGATAAHREIISLRQIEFLGEPVSVVAEAVASPWVSMPELSNLVLLVFVADATARLWRAGGRENRGRASRVGGGILAFLLVAAGFNGLVNHQVIQAPYLVSFPFLAIVLVMGYELSRDLLRAIQLARELRDSESHLHESERVLAEDLAERRRAELETQELRCELAHAGRVSLLGQLASALAHELSQPLGAILRNAEAAELMLQEPGVDLEELRAIVADIREDDRRAGNVIDRLRSLLKRGSLDPQAMDLKTVVSDVVALVRNEAAARMVKLEVAVPPELPAVRGDRVHLQQVLLNLIVNAMDALGEAPIDRRRVKIGASCADADSVEVSVSDCGPGIPTESLKRLFEPFFTTKPSGMGMGLPMSKTIIDAHQGRIWAENRPEGGAVLRFTVPVAQEEGPA